jgi:hypothetical protein
MKVKCIDISHKSWLLTIDKIYDVIEHRKDVYSMVSDDGTIGFYNVGRFIKIDDLRDKKIDDILK